MCTFELSSDAKNLAEPRGAPRFSRIWGPKATAAQVVERSAGSRAWDELVKSRTGGVQKSALEFFFKHPGHGTGMF